ncbi:MAG: hypothetical protein LBL83_11595 [Clostridiales bacterium]|jgi:hypothetical protein|nr:hypothetical protein [Clostridiales bacterium]
MDTGTFEKVVESMLRKAQSVLINKEKEYATEDRLHNFRVAAAFQQCTMEQALFGFLVKQLVSISDMCKSGEAYAYDIWDEKIGDSINYLLLLRAVVADRNQSL